MDAHHLAAPLSGVAIFVVKVAGGLFIGLLISELLWQLRISNPGRPSARKQLILDLAIIASAIVLIAAVL